MGYDRAHRLPALTWDMLKGLRIDLTKQALGLQVFRASQTIWYGEGCPNQSIRVVPYCVRIANSGYEWVSSKYPDVNVSKFM